MPARQRAPTRRARRSPTAAAPTGRRDSTRWTAPRASWRIFDTAAGPAGATDGDGDVVERQRDRRLWLVDGDLDGVNPLVAHHVVGAFCGHRFDQIPGRATHDVGHPRGERAVVQRVGQVVAGGGAVEIDPHGDVDDELLTVPSLMLEHSVTAADGQAAQLDSVSHPSAPCTPGGP